MHNVQCQSIASAQFVQCKQCSVASVQFLKHSVYRVESVAYTSVVFSVSWVTVYGVQGLPTITHCR